MTKQSGDRSPTASGNKHARPPLPRWRSTLRTIVAGLVGVTPVVVLFLDEFGREDLPLFAALAGVFAALNTTFTNPAWHGFTRTYMPWLQQYEGRHRAED